MLVSFQNCKNIIEGSISIIPNLLNIRYGANGTGKTSASIAIQSLVDDDLRGKLIPFHDTTLVPNVTLDIGDLESIKVFNEEYIDRFLFKETNVLSEERVFEVLINDYQLSNRKEELLRLFENIKFSVNSAEICSFLDKIDNITMNLSLNSDGSKLNGSSKAFKALKDGNKYVAENIPEFLSDYVSLLTSNQNIQWIDWFGKGLDFDEKCPYCRLELPENFTDIKSLLLSNYKKADIQNAITFLSTIAMNLDYLSENIREEILEKFENVDELSAEDEVLVTNFYRLMGFAKVTRELQRLSEYSLLDENYAQSLFTRFIDLKTSLPSISNIELIEKLNDLETSINETLDRYSEYVIQKNIFNSTLRNKVYISQSIINEFMEISGIPYKVEIIETDTENPKIILKHISMNRISNILDGLSYGERNAFALIMFMLDVTSDSPQLVILDDPISSFDENKKYAIMHSLFIRRNIDNLRDKTVLMFTHDFTPVIDFVEIKRYPFVNAKYLKMNNGLLEEYDINRSEIKSVIGVAESLFKDIHKSPLSRLINYRRYLELTNDANNLKYEMVSSLLKNKAHPEIKVGDQYQPFSANERENTEIDIRTVFRDFSYSEFLDSFDTKEKCLIAYDNATNYERVNIIRVLKHFIPNDLTDSVILKFIDESYHIENTMTFQLDPNSFDNIPSYIINVCNQFVDRHR